MIPTTASNTPTTQTTSAVVIGIASLVLEGRALSEDEFAMPMGLSKRRSHQAATAAGAASATASQDTPRSSHVVNITMNPNAMSMSMSYQLAARTQPDTIQQRWTQKICQLRQSSPTVSREMALETIAVGVDDDQSSAAADLDRRMTLVYHHRPVPSPIAEKLHTLQSLATTCLRASPDNTSPNYGYTMLASSPSPSLPLVPAAAATTSPKYTSYFTSPPRSANPFGLNSPSSGSSSSSSTVSAASNSCCSADASPVIGDLPSSSSLNNNKKQSAQSGGGNNSTSPKQGPHCDQFLRKIGLAKGEAAELEDHICDISYGIKICIRWRTYCQEMEAIMARGEPICIEVYLGPATQKILLEQWIIAQKERTPGPTMTLPSLCSAIRSQLYFSQIYAWCDLIKKSDQTVLDTGRILFSSKTAAGSPPTGGQRPRLNIFYRIKTYDSTASFNSKPTVHNFPNVVISEGTCLSVCVKSLPRIHSGIPRVGDCSTAGTATAPVAGIGALFSVTPVGSNVVDDNVEKANAVTVRRASMSQLSSSSIKPTGHSESMTSDKNSNCSMYDDDDGSSDATLSHRERQLLKYKKRMLKRDKKTFKPISTPPSMAASSSSENGASPRSQNSARQESTKYQHMQLDDKINGVLDESFAADVPSNGQQQSLPPEYGSINSIRPPLYRPSPPPSRLAESVQTHIVEMISTGTQTANFTQSAVYPSCDLCGNEMSIVCMNCDENFAEITPLNKADLLLQAIQRTPKVARNRNNNNSPAMVHQSARSSNVSDCQVCKRQKTQHHFRGGARDVDMEAQHQTKNNNNNNCSNGKRNGVCANGAGDPPCDCRKTSSFRMDEDDDSHHDGWNTVKNHNTAIKENSSPPPQPQPPVLFVSNYGGGSEGTTPQFKTPTSQANGMQSKTSPQSSSKPNLLQLLNGASPGDTRKLRNLPKVNLTQIFCSSTTAPSSSSPIPISSCSPSSPEVSTFTFDVTNGGAATSPMTSATITTTTINNLPSPEASIRVQKSYSAPTLPNSPSLSPRFAKQAAFYKRRSRHLSDRSDRSSLGSDEQFSDEELEAGVYSPASSPIKFRSRIAAFGRKPLLGNLEESLLQRRFAPKMEVAGFRVLLGASGAFCPTQLTIPAAAYFYELRGAALSTPYVCEIRLPRKGYIIPSTGTVQATLLNPMGTVVRMFVIPYDFKDMPPWHQTFIRQRVLAEEPSSLQQQQEHGERPTEVSGCRGAAMSMMARMHGGSSLGHMISSDNMKRLRYSIHLRFQTSRSGRLTLHTDIRLLISRRTDCDTAAAHAKGVLEAPNDLTTDTVMPNYPKYSARQENPNKI